MFSITDIQVSYRVESDLLSALYCINVLSCEFLVLPCALPSTILQCVKLTAACPHLAAKCFIHYHFTSLRRKLSFLNYMFTKKCNPCACIL